MERVEVEVDVDAIGTNVATLRARLGPRTAFAAVVKADGYGHGAVRTAVAAKAAGAEWLAVVSAREARELRDAGVDGPVLVMGALTPPELSVALAADADVVAWTSGFLEAVAGEGRHGRVHVKLDTGMGRLGTRDPEAATALVRRAVEDPALDAVGLMTHFATADEADDEFMDEQLARFAAWTAPLKAAHPTLLRHAANSAATLRDPETHLDLVRCGIAIYGMDPSNVDPQPHGLRPALSLRSVVAAVKPCAAGESAGYGRRFVAERDTVLATVPIGYGDGWRRGLTNTAEVLIGGRRHPQVGTVSMDNITVDLGPDGAGVRVGDVVTLVGADGEERILAETVAQALGTINYEVTCGLLPRATRRTVGGVA